MSYIGFIGLGHMGAPMALNLHASGLNVIAYDAYLGAMKNFQAKGGVICYNISDLSQASILMSMLPSEKELFSIYHEKSPLLQGLKPQTLLIDCSTVGPIAAQKWHQLAKRFQLESVDAPVSGGVAAATSGHLSFMIGGKKEAVEKAKHILMHMGERFIETGGETSGQVAKICNNLVLANTMVAISEAFLLAESLGMDASKLQEVLQVSSGNSWVVENYLPLPSLQTNTPANHDYQPGFSAKMMLKDLRLGTDAAKAQKLKLNLSENSEALYASLVKDHAKEIDFSYIYAYLKKTITQ
jgi:3-hydroxyisobutyrate dehydrogenase